MRAQRRKADPKTGKHALCERALWKRTWTCHKSRFVLKFTRKMPDPKPARGILCGNLWKFTGKVLHTVSGQGVHTSIEHRAIYCDRKNPFGVATLFRE